MTDNHFWDLMVLELTGEFSGDMAALTVEFIMSNRVINSVLIKGKN